MTAHLDLIAQETARIASQIESCALAANCLLSGSQPADRLDRENAILDLLGVIEDLACRAGGALEAIERALANPLDRPASPR